MEIPELTSEARLGLEVVEGMLGALEAGGRPWPLCRQEKRKVWAARVWLAAVQGLSGGRKEVSSGDA